METGEADRENLSASLLFRSDFSGFGGLEFCDGSSGGSSEVDSDVEDAIYAHMYFEEQSGDHEISVKGNANHSIATVGDVSSKDGLSVSLVLDQPNSKVKKKKTKRSKKKQVQRTAPPPQPTNAAAIAGGGGSPSNDDDTTTADSQDEAIVGSKVNGGTSESETDSRLAADLVDKLNEKPNSGRKQVIETTQDNSSKDAVIIISSDSDIEIVSKGKDSKFTSGAVQSADIIEIVSSESSEESEGEEQGAGLEEEGEASSDMQLSDQEQDPEDVSIMLDPWHVNVKDQLGREEYDRRYGDSKSHYYGRNGGKCANCKQRYHSARKCPWPKRHQVCYLCGEVDHISSQCHNDLCTYCYQEKHRGRSCSAPWASPRTQCQRCFMSGHHAAICPDVWRQYHNTTYISDHLVIIEGRDQRRFDRVFCCNCSLPGHYFFECSRTRPRGWPQPHLPLIAKYATTWPPSNIREWREELGISKGQEVTENHYERRKRKLSEEEMTGGSPRKRSRGRKGKGDDTRREDLEERRKNWDRVSIGPHPALKKKQHAADSSRRSNSLNAGLLTNRGSSLLGTPTHNNTWSHDSPHSSSSSLLPTPVTPAGHMLPPLRSHSSHSSERRGEKRPHYHSLGDQQRRDSEPAILKRPRLTQHTHSLGQGEDYPREPLFATPPSHHGRAPPQHSSTPYLDSAPPPRRSQSDVNERVHYHRDSNYTHYDDQPHSSRQLFDNRYHPPNSAHQPHPPHYNLEDARELINRRMSYNEDHNRGALPPYHRRLSDYSEQSGGMRTPPAVGHQTDRHKRHRTEDGWMINDRGFRGQPHLLRNNYKH